MFKHRIYLIPVPSNFNVVILLFPEFIVCAFVVDTIPFVADVGICIFVPGIVIVVGCC